ncbi:hypothetical protein HDE_06180 [Halotydeus destructor]|nr:hypothetical protein HDE_06180 [Halotydeus destructor]
MGGLQVLIFALILCHDLFEDVSGTPVVVGLTDMTEPMQNKLIAFTSLAIDEFDGWEERQLFIKHQSELLYGQSWNVVIGGVEQFSFQKPREACTFISFTMKGAQAYIFQPVTQPQLSTMKNKALLNSSIAGSNRSQLLTHRSTERKRRQLSDSPTEYIPNRELHAKLESCRFSTEKMTSKFREASIYAGDCSRKKSACEAEEHRLALSRDFRPIVNQSLDYVEMKRDRRAKKRDMVVRWGNNDALRDSVFHFLSEALEGETDLQVLARSLFTHMGAKYPNYKHYCFVTDRDVDYGVNGWGNNERNQYHVTMSVRGITVTVYEGYR